MHLKLLLFLLFCTGQIAFSQSPKKESQSPKKEIDNLLTAYQQLNQFNGNVLVSRKGKIIFEKAYGYQNAKAKKKNTVNSIFQIASLTKTFTSAIILKLAEEKKLSIQDKLSKYFPQYPQIKDVTIEHLLTHTSGIYEILREPTYFDDINTNKSISNDKRISYFIDKPLDFEPGVKFSYSNSGYILLGNIIEKVTNLSYEQAINKYIFKQFNMKDSGYNFQELSSKNKTKSYSYLSPTRQTEVPFSNAELTYSSGALYSNLKDLYKWNLVISKNKFLSKATLDKAFESHLSGYGYGWFIDNIYQQKVVSHGGNIEGGTSYFARVIQDDICIILLNNITNTRLERIGNSILAILYKQPYKTPQAKKEIQLEENILDSYVGKYDVSTNYQVTIAKKDKQLYFQVNNEVPIRIYAETQASFFVKDDDMNINFSVSDDKKTQTITIRQGLSRKSGEKISLIQ